LRAAGEVPGQPRVDSAEKRIARFGLFTRSRNVIEYPAQLEAGKIGGDGQARLFAQAVRAALLGVTGDQLVGARIHPDDCIIKRRAGLPVPEQRGFALVGESNGSYVARRQICLPERGGDDVLRVAPDFHRIVLDPARFGINLLVFALVAGDDIALPVEDDETRTRGSLVDGTDKLRHGAGSSKSVRNECKRKNMKLKIEHFQQKCEAVLRRIMRKNKEIDRFRDSARIRTDLNEGPGTVGSGASINVWLTRI